MRTFLSQVCCYCVVEARDRLVGLSESGCGASRWDHTHRADVENGTKLRLRGRRREPCFLSLRARRPPPVAAAVRRSPGCAAGRHQGSPCTAACRSPPPPSSLCSFLEFLILVLVISECSMPRKSNDLSQNYKCPLIIIEFRILDAKLPMGMAIILILIYLVSEIRNS